MVRSVNLVPDEIVAVLENPVEKSIILIILQAFANNELTYKIRTQWKPSSSTEPDDYRVFCYIKKSKEALIINTKYSNPNSFCLQVRIFNKSTFEKLDEYTENIRNQILNGRNCMNCNECKKSPYIFNYKGKLYRKCYQLHNNFWFSNFNSDDVDSILDIIKREIEFGKPKRRK